MIKLERFTRKNSLFELNKSSIKTDNGRDRKKN